MTVAQLASVTDVEAVLGRNLTTPEGERVNAILDKVSELFRLAAGQQFTPDVSEVWLTVHNGMIRLPQQPAVEVLSVLTPDDEPVQFTFVAGRLRVGACMYRQLLVEYKHGGDVPDLVRTTVADIVQKILTIPVNAQAGVQQFTETNGPFSETYTYAAWALGGQASLSPEDRRVAESFRTQQWGTVHVAVSR